MKWTREQIIRAILKREAAGLPLSTGGDQGVDSTLYQAGARVFGSWRNAVMAAGIPPNRVFAHDRWPPARILAAIRTLARKGRPRRNELQRRNASLVQAAARTYGSWPKAVIAAGVDPIKFRRVPPWTKDRIIEAILVRVLKNEPLGSTTVRPESLAEAAARFFGSWGSALAAAGLDPKRYMRDSPYAGLAAIGEDAAAGRPPQRWSREAVCQAILARLRKQRSMNASAVRIDDKSLYWGSKKRFGSWRDALRAAGLNPEEFQQHGGRRRAVSEPASDGSGGNRCLSHVTS
jgi:hypothetical protein